MTSLEFSNSVLQSKFRGCIVGALVGDCLGIPFEFKDCEVKGDSVRVHPPEKQKLGKFMTDLINGESTEDLHYTDDTAMTLNIATSLVEKGELDVKDVAEKFTYDFFHQERGRGYGTHVRRVFTKLRDSRFKNVFLPAKEQFDGQGSFGNGAAMRISPIALFGNNKSEEYMMEVVKQSSLITHYHPNGYRGAMLQCLAVSAALRLDPSQKFDPIKFIDGLLEKMKHIETEETKPYCDSLQKMKEIFVKNHDEYVTSEEISQSLGNGDDVSALKSVPTAIFSFLRGMKPFTNKEAPRFVPTAVYSLLSNSEKHYFESDNPFMRTIYFAISVGGDTDTIGSMAGAIAGAYYGEEMIPDVVKKKCEKFDDIVALADKLFDATYKKN